MQLDLWTIAKVDFIIKPYLIPVLQVEIFLQHYYRIFKSIFLGFFIHSAFLINDALVVFYNSYDFFDCTARTFKSYLIPNCFYFYTRALICSISRICFISRIFSGLKTDVQPLISSLDGSLQRRLDEESSCKNSHPCRLKTSDVQKTSF